MSISPSDDLPVFAGGSARRRRLVSAAGAVAGAVLIMFAVVMASGFTSTGPYRPPAWPERTSTAPRTPRPTPAATAAPAPGTRR